MSKPISILTRWGILWRSENKLDGKNEHLVWNWRDQSRKLPVLFRTRKEARAFKRQHYGNIMDRPDLRAEPHGWKPPKVVKLRVTMEIIK